MDATKCKENKGKRPSVRVLRTKPEVRQCMNFLTITSVSHVLWKSEVHLFASVLWTIHYHAKHHSFYLGVLHPVAHLSNWFFMTPSK
jgi:hypothetical protein